MPKFGENSKKHLNSCHEDLQIIFNAVIVEIDCSVICGHRNEEDQEKAFNKGNSKVHFPKGKHNSNPSTAVDVYPYPIDFDDLPRFYWFAGWVLAKAEILRNVGEITHNVRWGGNWDGFKKGIIDFSYNKRQDVLDDLPHFELKPND
tara:strand:- start:66 stop:506 length:441 start_codon:yes stop_codon:yes gene_type:complete